MTTIAFDGKTLAGDSQSSLFRRIVRKVHRLRDGRLFGSCGLLANGIAVRTWLEDGGEVPKVDDTFHAILIDGKSVYVLEDNLIKVQHDMGIVAVGSGRDFAMAAMHLGKSACEAVEVAAVFDVNTGGPVVEVSLDD